MSVQTTCNTAGFDEKQLQIDRRPFKMRGGVSAQAIDLLPESEWMASAKNHFLNWAASFIISATLDSEL